MNIKIIGIIGALICAPVFAEEENYPEIPELEEVVETESETTETEIVDKGAIEEVPAPRAVVARLSCDEINERVYELREDIKAYPELAPDLEYMLSRQRTQCAARANRRPVHNYGNVNPVTYIEDAVVEEASTEEPVAQEPEPIVVEKTPEELATEQAKIEENRAKGLCDDGVKPNRYGCCDGEKFKEVSRMVFACCPKEDSDGECIEPRKKK